MSHSNKLISAIEDISNQEIEALQKYCQENATKPEILLALKSVLNETVDEVRSVTINSNFLPEFKDAKERKEESNLIKIKKDLLIKLNSIDHSVENFNEFSNKYDISTTASNPKSSSKTSTNTNANKENKVILSYYHSCFIFICDDKWSISMSMYVLSNHLSN